MIEKLDITNVKACIQLAHVLWPDEDSNDLEEDFNNIILSNKEVCFLYVDDKNKDKYLGFIQMSIRMDYVEGSNSSPVVYVEGIYVVEEYRKRGIARELLQAGENWGKQMECREIASDCDLANNVSIDFHKCIGFKEANRIVCFVKGIGN